MSKIETKWLPVGHFGLYIYKICPVLSFCNTGRTLYLVLSSIPYTMGMLIVFSSILSPLLRAYEEFSSH